MVRNNRLGLWLGLFMRNNRDKNRGRSPRGDSSSLIYFYNMGHGSSLEFHTRSI